MTTMRHLPPLPPEVDTTVNLWVAALNRRDGLADAYQAACHECDVLALRALEQAGGRTALVRRHLALRGGLTPQAIASTIARARARRNAHQSPTIHPTIEENQ